MNGIEELKQMLASRSTDYGKMSQILNWYLLNNDCEYKKKLEAALVSALRYIADEKYDEFTDEDGNEVESWQDGNLSTSVCSNDFGRYVFDFNECLRVLESGGVRIEGPANRKRYDFSSFLQQFRTKEGAEKAMGQIMKRVNEDGI